MTTLGGRRHSRGSSRACDREKAAQEEAARSVQKRRAPESDENNDGERRTRAEAARVYARARARRILAITRLARARPAIRRAQALESIWPP